MCAVSDAVTDAWSVASPAAVKLGDCQETGLTAGCPSLLPIDAAVHPLNAPARKLAPPAACRPMPRPAGLYPGQHLPKARPDSSPLRDRLSTTGSRAVCSLRWRQTSDLKRSRLRGDGVIGCSGERRPLLRHEHGFRGRPRPTWVLAIAAGLRSQWLAFGYRLRPLQWA